MNGGTRDLQHGNAKRKSVRTTLAGCGIKAFKKAVFRSEQGLSKKRLKYIIRYADN